MAGNSKEPCGCVSDGARWIALCPTHESERTGREHEVALDSLQWLMKHYDKFPNEDNLRHAVKRLREVGQQGLRLRQLHVQWIASHREQILAQTRKRS